MMTPMEFSTPLISASVDPGDIYNAFKRAWRDSQARRIQERSRVSSRNSNVFAPPKRHPSSRTHLVDWRPRDRSIRWA